MHGQICLNDMLSMKTGFTSKNCAATLDVCTHRIGICADGLDEDYFDLDAYLADEKDD